jgi:hypothetical protein
VNGEALASWLSLREAADARARSTALTDAVAGRLPTDAPLRLVDLATGTGSNIRYLALRLHGEQQWLAVDGDAVLLRHVPHDVPGAPVGSQVETRCVDLGPSTFDLFANRNLVTASALLDLVSAQWIGDLAAQCREAGACVLFALSYDGRFECTPGEPEDDVVRGWFNDHQRQNDKGFGRAAGPDAWQVAVTAFRDAGYDVRHERSDWVLMPDEAELQRQLIDGWAQAASEIASAQSASIADWRARRLAHVNEGQSRIVVGHQDIAGWLASFRSV